MRHLLRRALGQMTRGEFFTNLPDGSRVIERNVHPNIYFHLRTIYERIQAEGQNQNIEGLQFHGDHVKTEGAFQRAMPLEQWNQVKRRFPDLFSQDGNGSVIPDICLHRPDNITRNSLAIEIKCGNPSNYSVYHDFRKLRLYTDPQALNFHTGIFLYLNCSETSPITSLTRWGQDQERSASGASSAGKRNALRPRIATPSPVAGRCFYIWQVSDIQFLENGKFNIGCINETIVFNNTFGDNIFIEDY
ncbi:hypothetical protein [Gluconobacter oxydans]|uniref:Restriction endonuclease n=1 Tax=Gluconobacter oxydans DSM 3504 TaxID=1288313 RepID=A0A067Z222_GLUOY|nr:hypothetical protein [Gluconobacter oxydans]AHK70082.1 hypothetical protein GLS_c01540 [Gluconobacter oxydans DSM 3504]